MIDTAPTGKGGGPTPFVNAFTNPTLGSLRYNTSQAGSPIFIAYGTQRIPINLLEFWNFTSSSGSPSPGGKGIGGSSDKKGSGKQYSVDVAFGICQGPVSFTGSSYAVGGNNRIWANGGISAGLGAVGLNGYAGADGQAPDPVFVSSDPNQPVIGYSGTCYVTGTPLNLGSSSALPDISFEICGIRERHGAGRTTRTTRGHDLIVADLLTNPRYGAGFPAANLDTAGALADWEVTVRRRSSSCTAARQAATGRTLARRNSRLTVSAIVWSAPLLKFIPYGDRALSLNGDLERQI